MAGVVLSKMGISKILARHTGNEPKPMESGKDNVLVSSPNSEEASDGIELDPAMELMSVLIKAIKAGQTKMALRQFKRLLDVCSMDDSEEESDDSEME
jgi:hypothetical protein